MKYLLIGAALGMAAVACSDVRVVDDDGAGNGDSQGGTTVAGGASAAGGAPSTKPAQARLFTTWHGTEDLHGFQLWNDPDQTGVDREPDARVQIVGRYVRGLAVVGDTLVVYDDHADLQIFDDAWGLTAGAQPTTIVELSGSADSSVPLRGIPGLDWLWMPSGLVRDASGLATSAELEQPGWVDPVYDEARDRLFVLTGNAVEVIDNVSTSSTLEPSWTLFAADDSPIRNLVSDGQSLFASGSSGSPVGSNVLVWPLEIAEPSSPDQLYANASGFTALAGIPTGGVLAASDSAIWGWEGASASSQTNSGWDVQGGAYWQALSVSRAGVVYVCGNGMWVYADPTLGEPTASTVDGENTLLLIERDLPAP